MFMLIHVDTTYFYYFSFILTVSMLMKSFFMTAHDMCTWNTVQFSD